jgi:hypothetical protein
MKVLCSILLLLIVFLLGVKPVNAQALSPTTSIQQNVANEPQASGSGVLNSFFSGFDWVSSGLIFNTPELLGDTITLKDGTVLSGLSQFRTIFSDIAIPIFVLIVSYTALSHITHDNTVQLKNFFKRLVFVVVLFIVTPAILSYSIQFVNLLNEKIIAQNAYNLATFVQNYVNTEEFRRLTGASSPFPTVVFNMNTILQILVLVIAVGFFLIGFLYIVFQAMIRFISLLFLSVIFPLVLPFALSEKTENITNTYFKTWFTFLIQQPAFVLGFAIVSSILGSIIASHGGSMGTLFLFSGSLIFLGGVNIFVGRIFGDGWSMMSTNAQSMMGSGALTGSVREIKRGAITGHAVGARSYAGAYIGRKIGLLKARNKPVDDSKTGNAFGSNYKDTSYRRSNTNKQSTNNTHTESSRAYTKSTTQETKEKMQKRPIKKQTETNTSQPHVTKAQYAKAATESKQSPTHFSTIKRGSYNSHFPSQSTKNEPFSKPPEVRQPFKPVVQPEKKRSIKK